MGKSTINAMFNSYVSLPEGMLVSDLHRLTMFKMKWTETGRTASLTKFVILSFGAHPKGHSNLSNSQSVDIVYTYIYIHIFSLAEDIEV